jgi:hypothetical protein
MAIRGLFSMKKMTILSIEPHGGHKVGPIILILG